MKLSKAIKIRNLRLNLFSLSPGYYALAKSLLKGTRCAKKLNTRCAEHHSEILKAHAYRVLATWVPKAPTFQAKGEFSDNLRSGVFGLLLPSGLFGIIEKFEASTHPHTLLCLFLSLVSCKMLLQLCLALH